MNHVIRICVETSLKIVKRIAGSSQVGEDNFLVISSAREPNFKGRKMVVREIQVLGTEKSGRSRSGSGTRTKGMGKDCS